jgi:PAS domain S-box-containing protein
MRMSAGSAAPGETDPVVLRVLLVAASDADAAPVLAALAPLQRTIDSQRADSLDGLRAALAEPWDLLLFSSDVAAVPLSAALAARRDLSTECPFVVIAPEESSEAAVAAMRAGADDFLPRTHLSRLPVIAERELRERSMRQARRVAEQRYRSIVETTSQGIWTSDVHTQISFANARMLQMVGYTRDEAIGLPATAFLDEKGPELVERLRVRRLQGLSDQLEVRFRRKDGSYFWCLAEMTPQFDAAGVFQGVIGMALDVSERRAAEEALRRAEQRYQRLSDSGLVGLTVGDAEGRIYEANDAYLRMIGYSREEMLSGKASWRDLLVQEAPIPDYVAKELREKGSAHPWETVHKRKNGSRVPVLVGVAMLDETRVLVVLSDLTERKRAEEALKRTEDQLRQSQKMEAIGLLAGGVAHDFNNMLSVVLSYSSLILRELKPDNPMREDVEEIQKAGSRAADLTQKLLTFSRRQVLQPKALDLNSLVDGMRSVLRRVLGEDIKLVFAPAPSLGPVFADTGSMEQVVMNLSVNARDAMPAGGQLTLETAEVELDEAFVQTRPGLRSGRHVVLSISDTGTGMDAETKARIFEPFFTTKEKSKGTGLGLSTTLGIVQQSGGAIRVDSTSGRGSTFLIYLPVFQGAPAAATSSGDRPGGGETILLAEDEAQVRRVTALILRRLGYRVLEARDGSDALAVAEAERGQIHLLLTDVVMPEKSGPELARLLGPLRPDMKILFMSGYTDDTVLRHGVSIAAVQFLQKPFTPDALTEKVREVLGAAPALRS